MGPTLQQGAMQFRFFWEGMKLLWNYWTITEIEKQIVAVICPIVHILVERHASVNMSSVKEKKNLCFSRE
ncbi:hypothetical protein AQUCO_03500183v1 [Aquilegia coerulea]|uniref:Uncharacterized protein n=1 Tax=Aquilegia coerulea TaxID=218851 RepID=A0A2G5CWK9_AQUCA|nr:hypothetical protein AQUCO_03500183v1 [Aquilegia coerulea]